MYRSLRSVSASFNLMRRIPRATAAFYSTTEPVDPIQLIPKIPKYDIDKPQSLEHRKARLQYQSRKRGMLENDLLLSTFAKKYLNGFNEKQTLMYDRLINSPSNDWDIFHWMIEKTPTPEEFNNEVMDLLKVHARNETRTSLRMPDLE